MAAKRIASRKKTKSPALTASISVTPTDDAPMIYANHAEVSHTQHDFSITFAKIPSKLSADRIREVQAAKQLILEPLMQVVIPTSLMAGLIDALTIQQAKHKALKPGKIKR